MSLNVLFYMELVPPKTFCASESYSQISTLPGTLVPDTAKTPHHNKMVLKNSVILRTSQHPD